MSKEERQSVSTAKILVMATKSLVPPMLLIIGVLGSIFAGVATATEAAAIGAFLAGILVVAYGKFTWKSLYEACLLTLGSTGMVFAIF